MNRFQGYLAVLALGLSSSFADIPLSLPRLQQASNITERAFGQMRNTPLIKSASIGYYIDSNMNGIRDKNEQGHLISSRVPLPLPEGAVITGCIPKEHGEGKIVHLLLRDIRADVYLIDKVMDYSTNNFSLLGPGTPLGMFTLNTRAWKEGILERKERMYIFDQKIFYQRLPAFIPDNQIREMSHRELVQGERNYSFECHVDGKLIGESTFSVQYEPLGDVPSQKVPVEPQK
ncbi:MAG: hypothetical protein AABY00_03815 [Nanoarchaeota archaeon]